MKESSHCFSVCFIHISGVVMSPNFPNIYPNSIDRTDMISVAPEKRIEIVFTNFTVQLHPDCRHDQLSIIDQDGSQLLGLSCGLELPPGEHRTSHNNSEPTSGVRSKSNIVFIKFFTDNDPGSQTLVPLSGWRLEWKSINP